ncbi:MAG: hypothetical protein WCI27_06290, partial [Candidatus Omnitrophota bacterium]
MIRPIVSLLLCFFMLMGPELSYAQALLLPAPGRVVGASEAYMPLIFKGITVHPDNPLLFDFMVDTGNSGLNPGADDAAIREQSNTMVKYFLASLTLPEKDQWVNLSPFEKDRILPEELGRTELGRDMLAEDYLLKQVTASFIHPDTDLGRTFWAKVYSRAQRELGVSDIPVDTFNKVWISADRADVFVHDSTAFVVGAHLKVQLEADYIAMSHQKDVAESSAPAGDLAASRAGAVPQEVTGLNPAAELSKKLVREIILPELEKEVNAGKNFARLRQIFHAMILATWYKKNLKDALLNQVYTNKKKTGGVEGVWVDHQGADIDPRQIWSQYEAAYKQGVFNLIKEDIDQRTGETLPRKYFAGGLLDMAAANVVDQAGKAEATGKWVKVTAQMQNLDDSMLTDIKEILKQLPRISKKSKMERVMQKGKASGESRENRMRLLKEIKSVILRSADGKEILQAVRGALEVVKDSVSLEEVSLAIVILKDAGYSLDGIDYSGDMQIVATAIEQLKKYQEQLKQRNAETIAVVSPGSVSRQQAVSMDEDEVNKIIHSLYKVMALIQKRQKIYAFIRLDEMGFSHQSHRYKDLNEANDQIESAITALPKNWKEVAFKEIYLPLQEDYNASHSTTSKYILNQSELLWWQMRIGLDAMTAMLPSLTRRRGKDKAKVRDQKTQAMIKKYAQDEYILSFPEIKEAIFISGNIFFVKSLFERLSQEGASGEETLLAQIKRLLQIPQGHEDEKALKIVQ